MVLGSASGLRSACSGLTVPARPRAAPASSATAMRLETRCSAPACLLRIGDLGLHSNTGSHAPAGRYPDRLRQVSAAAAATNRPISTAGYMSKPDRAGSASALLMAFPWQTFGEKTGETFGRWHAAIERTDCPEPSADASRRDGGVRSTGLCASARLRRRRRARGHQHRPRVRHRGEHPNPALVYPSWTALPGPGIL